jgi:hypothetical protein
MSLPAWLSGTSVQQAERNVALKPKQVTSVKKVNNRTPYLAPPRIRVPNTPNYFEDNSATYVSDELNNGGLNNGGLNNGGLNNGELNNGELNNTLSVSTGSSVNSSPPGNFSNNLPNNLVPVTPAFVNKKVGAPRLPNGSVNYNAMAKQWKEGVKSGKINVTAKVKNSRSLQQQVANLTQSNRNRMERNKKALARAVMRNSSIKNKSHFMEAIPGVIPKNMRNRIREQNALNEAAKKARAKQNALNALRGQKGKNVNRHTESRGKTRKSRKNRRN